MSVNVEIAHIRSGRPNGPRHDSSWPSTEINVESNFLLLCREHHKWVDDHPQRYPVDELLNWKQAQVAQDDGIELDDVQVTQILHSLSGPLVFLPYRSQDMFVGRAFEFERLEQIFCASNAGSPEADASQAVTNQPVGVIHGLGGVGKSTLASYFAYQHLNNHRVTWWITADSEQALLQGLAELAVALNFNLNGESLEVLVEQAIAWLASHDNWLLILDNVTRPADVMALLGRCRTGKVLLTSRLATGWPQISASVLSLDVLDIRQAIDLMTCIIRQQKSGAPIEGAEDLCVELGCLPLAIEQAAGYLAETEASPREYLKMLRDYPAEMYSHWPAGYDGADRTVARIWHSTLDRLATECPQAGSVLRMLAWFAPTTIPRELVRISADAFGGLPQAETAVGRLAAYNLISLDDKAIGMHRLVQAVARTPDVKDAHRQPNAIASARELATKAVVAAYPTDREDPAGWPWWRALLPHIRNLAEHIPPEDDTAWMQVLLQEAGSFLADQGSYRQALAYQLRAFSISESLFGSDHDLTITSRNEVARIYEFMGDITRAVEIYEENLERREGALGDDHLYTRTSRNNLAIAYCHAGEPERAVPLLEMNLAQHEEDLSPRDPLTLDARTSLGRAYLDVGRTKEAVRVLEKSLSYHEWELDVDHIGTMVARDHLASAYVELGLQVDALFPLFGMLLHLPEHGHPDAKEVSVGPDQVLEALKDRAELARIGVLLKEQNVVDSIGALGPDHPATLGFVASFCESCLKTGQTQVVVATLESGLFRFEHIFGQDHPTTEAMRGFLEFARSTM
ncbi:tetratricopeptide repeat protein [Actinomadura citrea]|uniref:tetratricopeptide repeat protein n=1 Tax=Actinomadura citrea TaxID=46158 RepID=UPI002E2DE2AB|nr:tetratricopeptide repeat protein [Actinomadura citrea]